MDDVNIFSMLHIVIHHTEKQTARTRIEKI